MACNLVHTEPLIEPMLLNIVESNLRCKLQWNVKQKSYIFIKNAFQYVVWEITDTFSRPQCVLMTTQVLKDTLAVIHK